MPVEMNLIDVVCDALNPCVDEVEGSVSYVSRSSSSQHFRPMCGSLLISDGGHVFFVFCRK